MWYNLQTFFSGILSDVLFWHSMEPRIPPVLVVANPSEKSWSEFVSWDDYSKLNWKVIKFHGSKPPTSPVIGCRF